MLFSDYPDQALVPDNVILSEMFPGRSHMYLPRLRSRLEDGFPQPAKIAGRNMTPVGELRQWHATLLEQREARDAA